VAGQSGDTLDRTMATHPETQPTLRQWLQSEPFALGLSAGFFGFFVHCGTLSVLEEEELLPTRLSGASAGALVGGMWAGGMNAKDLATELCALQRSDFWDPGLGRGLLRGDKFQRKLESLLGVSTFKECRVPLAVSVHDVRSKLTHVIDSGPLATGIRASCAVPYLFHPVRINGNLCADGALSDRSGLAGMPKGERLLFHHLASRSWWRSRDSMKVPARDNMTAVAIDNMPRVGPFKLHVGPIALAGAREAFRRALDVQITDSVIRLSG